MLPSCILAGVFAAATMVGCDAADATSPPDPTATLRPTPVPGSSVEGRAADEILDAFDARLTKMERGFHVVVALDYRGQESGFVRFDVEARGEDYDGTFHGEIPGETVDLDIIYVDGVAYARRAGEAWRIIDGYGDVQPMNPFQRLDMTAIEYLGTVELPSGTLHDLRTTTWMGRPPDPSVLADATISDSVFHVYVRDDGSPVEAQLTFTISGTAEGQSITLDYRVDYAFSDLGTDVTIAAPELSPAP